ncbi:ATP-binding protein [Thalassobaculum sp.]|uniref:ATP-binding protein n=1 Tax=Thalassobaculum sp. TaxID=2022740 RepID=UPI0032ECEE44
MPVEPTLIASHTADARLAADPLLAIGLVLAVALVAAAALTPTVRRLIEGSGRPDGNREQDAAVPPERQADLVVTAASRLEELTRLAAEIEAFAETHALPPRAAMHLDLAVEEIVSNAINYGFADMAEREDAIELSLTLEGDGVDIRIADRGRPFDPLSQAPEPDTEATIEERSVGGLGIHIVKTVMTGLRYTRIDDRNVLDMTLPLAAPDQAGEDATP